MRRRPLRRTLARLHARTRVRPPRVQPPLRLPGAKGFAHLWCKRAVPPLLTRRRLLVLRSRLCLWQQSHSPANTPICSPMSTTPWTPPLPPSPLPVFSCRSCRRPHSSPCTLCTLDHRRRSNPGIRTTADEPLRTSCPNFRRMKTTTIGGGKNDDARAHPSNCSESNRIETSRSVHALSASTGRRRRTTRHTHTQCCNQFSTTNSANSKQACSSAHDAFVVGGDAVVNNQWIMRSMGESADHRQDTRARGCRCGGGGGSG